MISNEILLEVYIPRLYGFDFTIRWYWLWFPEFFKENPYGNFWDIEIAWLCFVVSIDYDKE